MNAGIPCSDHKVMQALRCRTLSLVIVIRGEFQVLLCTTYACDISISSLRSSTLTACEVAKAQIFRITGAIQLAVFKNQRNHVDLTFHFRSSSLLTFKGKQFVCRHQRERLNFFFSSFSIAVMQDITLI